MGVERLDRARRQPSQVWLMFGLFLVVWAAEAGLGYDLCVVKQDIQNDALSRVANAFYVLYSRMPHLAAIGFVWNPLPSLLELLLVVLWPWFPGLVQEALAGVILSSLAAATQAVLWLRAALQAGVSRGGALLGCGLLVLHPFLFLYGSNGMSEMVFSCLLVWTTLQYLAWRRQPGGARLAAAGLGLALAFLTRYEAVAFGVALALVAAVDSWRAAAPEALPGTRRRQRQHIVRQRTSYLVASLVILLLPSVYAGLVWMAMNAFIMGDPLYFFHSAYSNLAQSSVLVNSSEFAALMGHPLRVLGFMAQRLWVFCLPLLALLLHRGRQRRLWQWDTLAVVLLSLSVPALQFNLLLHGASYGWLRFFFYPLPIAAAWWVYEWGLDSPSVAQAAVLPRQGRHRRRAAARRIGWLYPLSLLAAAAWTWRVMHNPVLAPEEYDTLYQRWNITRLQTTEAIAGYINQNLPDATVLMDSFSAFNVIIHCEHPQNLIITSDLDFQEALQHPLAHHVQYILVPNPQDSVFRFDAVNRQYPDLYARGAPWAKLVQSFDGWRLYAVLGSPR
ncbi:MAG: hypothetical protein K6T26_03395 [Alicyclobacillus sp.]|nr:hypothetical protein [Alicyclobacillus sp.]